MTAITPRFALPRLTRLTRIGMPSVALPRPPAFVVVCATVAVLNDNDFAIGEFDAEGRHVGSGVPSALLILDAPSS